MTLSHESLDLSESEHLYRDFFIDGADRLYDRALSLRRRSHFPTVVLITGPPASGKTYSSFVAQEILNFSPTSQENGIPPKYSPSIYPSKIFPSIEELLSKGIVDTDLFYHPRGSQERKKLPFSQWMRHSDLFVTFSRLADAIHNGESEIPMNRLYDRKSGTMRFIYEPIRLPIRQSIVISGLHAFRAEPVLKELQIPYIRILIEAEPSEIERRFIIRNKPHLTATQAIHHLHDIVAPEWTRLQAEITGIDLLWISHAKNQGITILPVRGELERSATVYR